MAYSYKNSKGTTYYLFKKEVNPKGSGVRTLYFFAKDENKEGAEPVNELPEGRTVAENERTGLPVLKGGGKSSSSEGGVDAKKA